MPLVKDGKLIGVLDLDSPKPARFQDLDARGLEEVARIFLEGTELSG